MGMKVLFVMNAFMNPSGAEHVLADFLKSTDEIDPVFIHIGPKTLDLTEFHEIVGESHFHYVHCSDLLRTPYSRQWFMRVFRWGLCKQLLSNKTISELRDDRTIDLVYFNNSFEAAVFYPLFQDRKTLVHIHDMVDMFRPAQKKCVLEACQKGARILTASKACKDMLVKNGIVDSKISVAYNSIDIPVLPYKGRTGNSIRVGFVGSCIKRKGFDVFISVLNVLNKRIGEKESIEAVIITNSNAKNPFAEKNLGLLDKSVHVEMYSGLPREEVFKKYGEMDLLLVPSRFDPLPTVVLEASLCGLPVFGANVDGIPEMLCDNRLLFSNDDIERAVAKIVNWLESPLIEKQEVVEMVQEHIGKTFTKENKRNSVLKAIKDVLNT